MNNKIRQDVIGIIDSRIDALIAETGSHLNRTCIQRELEMAIDLAGLTEAIGLDLQRNYKERLARIIAADYQQWPDSIRRIA